MKFTNKNTFPSIEVYNDDVQPNWQDLQHPSVYEYRKALSIDRCSQNVLWRHISNFYRVEDIVIIIMWIYSFQTGWCTLYFSWVHIFIFIFIAIGKNGINMNANNVTTTTAVSQSASINPIKSAEIISGAIRFLIFNSLFKYGDWLGFQHRKPYSTVFFLSYFTWVRM